MGILALLMAYPVILVLISTSSGPGVSPDSVSYLAGAQSLLDNGTLLTFTGEPLTLFPPGQSVLLAGLGFVGISLTAAAIVVNLICAVLLVGGTYLLGQRVLHSSALALVSAAFVSLSAATVREFSMVWSEPVFSVLVLSVLLLLVRVASRRQVTWANVIALAVLASAATCFRYAGFVMIPVIAVVVLWSAMPAGRGRAWALGVVSLLASSVGLIALALRNISVGSGALGERYPSAVTLEGAVKSTINLLGTYLVPSETSLLWAELGVVVAVLLVAGIWLGLIRRSRGVVVLSLFVTVYWLSLWWSQMTTRLDSATERLLAPALAPMVILVIFAVSALGATVCKQLAESRFLTAGAAHRFVLVVAWVALIAVLGLQVLHGVRFARDSATAGIGYNSSATLNAPVSQAIAALPEDSGIASNDPWRAYWVAGHGPSVDIPPVAAEWPQERIDADAARLLDSVRDGSVDHVAYFTGARNAWTPEELSALGLTLTPVGEFADGTLYSVAFAN
jgi:hypothetical protein